MDIHSILTLIRAGLALVLVFLLPGFAWSLVLFNGKQVNLLERIALSIGLSIALVTLTIFALNRLIALKVDSIHSLLVVLLLTAIPAAYYFTLRLIRRRHSKAAPPTTALAPLNEPDNKQ